LARLNEQLEAKYEILGTLREGGMGAVYMVRHRLLEEIRVVKVFRPQAPGRSAAAERFLREAKIAIRLHHPNIGLLHDFAVDEDGTSYIVMDYIDGWTLLEVLRTYGLPPLPLTLEIARQALRALAYLHRQHVVHRDISPDNLMLSRDDEGQPQVKLIDLGIVKPMEASGGGLTKTGVFLGKPRYASPEQFEGQGIGPQSDLYSLAVVLYELLTGCCPIEGTDAASLMAGHLLRPPLPFEEVDPQGNVPDDLRAVILHALAKKPLERMPGAEAFGRAIVQVQERYLLTDPTFDEVLAILLPPSPGGGPDAEEDPTQLRLMRRLELVSEDGGPPASFSRALGLTSQTTRQVSMPLRGVPTQEGRLQGEPVEEAEEDDAWDRQEIDRSEGLPSPLPAPAPQEPGPGAGRSARMRAALALALVGSGIGWYLLAGTSRPAHRAGGPLAAPLVPTSALSLPPKGPPPASPPRGRVRPMERGDLILPGTGGVEPVARGLPTYDYPPAARGSGRRARVRVALLVSENGRVLDTLLAERDPSGLGFNEIALDAARKARFQPATRDGLPGRMWTELVFDFAE